MQPSLLNYYKYKALVRKTGVMALIIIFICPVTNYSQKKLTESLLGKKANYENRIGFMETDTNYIKILYQLAGSYIYQIPDSTNRISERVVLLSKERGFEKGLAGGKLGLGLYHVVKGNFKRGFEFLEDATSRAERVYADTLLLKSINAKVMGQFMKGDYTQAYLDCKKGEGRAEKMGNLEMQVIFAMNLATAFAILRDYGQALPYYQKALRIVGRTNNEGHRAQIESNLGYLYLHMGHYEKAKSYCEKAIRILNGEKQQAWESFAWTTLGEVAIREQKYDMALDHFSRAITLLAPIRDMQRKAETLQGIADAHYLKGDLAKSLEHAQAAGEIARNVNYHNGIVKSSELLYKLFLEQDRPREALRYLSIAKHLSDSILKSENRTKFLMLETQAKFHQEKKRTEFENEKKLARQKAITYVSIVLLLAVLIIAFLIQKNVQDQKKANLSLKQLNDTKDKLFYIIGHDLKAAIGTLQELLELYSAKEISEKEVAQLAPRLKQNVDHSSFTLNNLLFWAKTQMNGVRPQIKPVPVKERIVLACNLYRSMIKAKNIGIACSIAADLKVMVDQAHLDIILGNSICNAIRYTNTNGSIRINGKVINSKTVEISVCDNGVGMNQYTIKAIHKGETIESTPGTMMEKGTGIGLQTVHGLIRANKGNFKLTSQPHKGTCIFLYFTKS